MRNFDVPSRIWAPFIGAVFLVVVAVVGAALAPPHVRDERTNGQIIDEIEQYLIHVDGCAMFDGGKNLLGCTEMQVAAARSYVLAHPPPVRHASAPVRVLTPE